jgi:hypothetical protein
MTHLVEYPDSLSRCRIKERNSQSVPCVTGVPSAILLLCLKAQVDNFFSALSYGIWFSYCSFLTIFSALPNSPFIPWINLLFPLTLSLHLSPSPFTCSLIHLYICISVIGSSLLTLQVFLLSLPLVKIFYLHVFPFRPFLRKEAQNETSPNTVTASHDDTLARSHVNQRNYANCSVRFRFSEFNCFVLWHSVDF